MFDRRLRRIQKVTKMEALMVEGEGAIKFIPYSACTEMCNSHIRYKATVYNIEILDIKIYQIEILDIEVCKLKYRMYK